MSNRTSLAALLAVTGLGLATSAGAATVTINSNTFDLDQFTGAAVTYRDDALDGVGFSGKLWDQAAGVDGFTLGELASVQAGGDPGDQISLTSTGSAGPDWLQLTYGTGITITAANSDFIIYEITSSSTGVDAEGTSFRVSFNGGAFINASSAVATHLPATTYPGTGAEDTNQIVFDLLAVGTGLSSGDLLTSVRIENLDSGPDDSDPDFIFAGVVAPEPGSLALLGLGGLAVLRRRR